MSKLLVVKAAIERMTACFLLFCIIFNYPIHASAKIVTCHFDKWKAAWFYGDFVGNQKKNVSWIGTKFRVDTTTNKIQVGWKSGWSRKFDIEEVHTNSRFTTYVFYYARLDKPDDPAFARYSYRIYQKQAEARGYVEPEYIVYTTDDYILWGFVTALGHCDKPTM